MSVEERAILETFSDYQPPDLEPLRKKLGVEWNKFLAKDLPTIGEAIAGVSWPDISSLPAA